MTFAGHAAQNRPDTRYELTRTEGLSQIIIRTQVKAPKTILQTRTGTQNNCRGRRIRRAQSPQNLRSIAAGKVQIQKNHVVPGLSCLRVSSLDGRSLPLQVDGDFIGDVPEAVFGIRPRALTVVS